MSRKKRIWIVIGLALLGALVASGFRPFGRGGERQFLIYRPAVRPPP